MIATYNAPAGDETTVNFFGVTFHDGEPTDCAGMSDHGLSKIVNHPLFDVWNGVEIEPGVEIMAPRKRGRPPKIRTE